MSDFKFGRPYNEFVFVNLSTDLLERNIAMFQRLGVQRMKQKEEYDARQRESIQRYVDERDDLTRRRWDEQKGYQHGF